MASSSLSKQQGWLFMGQYEARLNSMARRSLAPFEEPLDSEYPIDMV